MREFLTSESRAERELSNSSSFSSFSFASSFLKIANKMSTGDHFCMSHLIWIDTPVTLLFKSSLNLSHHFLFLHSSFLLHPFSLFVKTSHEVHPTPTKVVAVLAFLIVVNGERGRSEWGV